MADERDSPAFGRGGPVAGTLPARERLRPRPVARGRSSAAAWACNPDQYLYRVWFVLLISNTMLGQMLDLVACDEPM